MKPVMIHADGTDCHHEGAAQATVHDEGGPKCAAGLPVTHVRFNGREMTVEEAYASLKNIADVFAKQLTPVITAFVKLAAQIGAAMEPTIRVLATAAAVVDEERELDDDDELWPDQFMMKFGKAAEGNS
jgi:hypothetical protein